MNFTMKCQKCGIELPENEIHISHDIPKYMGGTDADGRHSLCEKCHNEYEWEIIKVGIMYFVKGLNSVEKITFRKAAKLVKNYFFKEKNDR